MRTFPYVLLLITLAGQYLLIIWKVLPVVPATSTAAAALMDSAEAANLQALASTDISILKARIDTLEHALSKHAADADADADAAAADPSSSLKLPTCESLMRNSHLGADGSFLTRSPTTWALRHDGSRELQLPLTCRLKRYTSTQARKCLNQRHLAFIGDSLTRYQFLSLAYFVERGEYPPRFGISSTQQCSHINEQGIPTCSPDDEPNVCMEGDWQSWQKFHSALGGSTDGSMFHGRMQCGCARREGGSVSDLTDNALYVSDSGIRISFVCEVGKGDIPGPIHGWNFTDCAEKGTCRTTQEDSDFLFNRSKQQDWDWNEPLYQALNGTLQQVLHGVDIVIYNRGLWGVLNQDLIETIMPLIRNWVGDKGRCFYKTTTGDLNTVRPPELSYIKNATFTAGCGFLDFGHLAQEFNSLMYRHPAPPKEESGKIWNFQEWGSVYWDRIHFTPWVYEELNNLFLNVLCNGKTTK